MGRRKLRLVFIAKRRMHSILKHNFTWFLSLFLGELPLYGQFLKSVCSGKKTSMAQQRKYQKCEHGLALPYFVFLLIIIIVNKRIWL